MEVTIVSLSILNILLIVLILRSIFATNKNMISLEEKMEEHISIYKKNEEENLRIRKTQAIVLEKLSQHI